MFDDGDHVIGSDARKDADVSVQLFTDTIVP